MAVNSQYLQSGNKNIFLFKQKKKMKYGFAANVQTVFFAFIQYGWTAFYMVIFYPFQKPKKCNFFPKVWDSAVFRGKSEFLKDQIFGPKRQQNSPFKTNQLTMQIVRSHKKLFRKAIFPEHLSLYEISKNRNYILVLFRHCLNFRLYFSPFFGPWKIKSIYLRFHNWS